jgi:hypothetical protein
MRKKNLAEMSFLFSQDEWFPTWWTAMPKKDPMITGWAPFRSAERLSGQSQQSVGERSAQTLAVLRSVSLQKLEGALEATYFHDWQSDPFSRGAYSYGKVGSDGAQQALGAPIENVIFLQEKRPTFPGTTARYMAPSPADIVPPKRFCSGEGEGP